MNPQQIQKTARILGVVVLVGVIIYLLSTNVEGISVALKDDHLSLSYSSGDSFDIRYKDILSVTEIKDLELGKYVSGTETNRYKFGVWDSDGFGQYNLCIYADVMRYIVVETSNRFYILNFESADATESFYKAFLDWLQAKRAEAAT